MNRVTVHWTGPGWLRRFDPKRKLKLFWRVHSAYIGQDKTTDQMLKSLAKLRYLSIISVGGRTKFSDETIRHLRDKFEVRVENLAMYQRP